MRIYKVNYIWRNVAILSAEQFYSLVLHYRGTDICISLHLLPSHYFNNYAHQSRKTTARKVMHITYNLRNTPLHTNEDCITSMKIPKKYLDATQSLCCLRKLMLNRSRYGTVTNPPRQCKDHATLMKTAPRW